MLKGKELGAAIRAALKMNGKSPADAARHFVVKKPSVSGWMATGRISKENFNSLVSWLDKTPLSHWGMDEYPQTRSPIVHESATIHNIPQAGGTVGEALEVMAAQFAGVDESTRAIIVILLGDLLAGRRTAGATAAAIEAMLKSAGEMPKKAGNGAAP